MRSISRDDPGQLGLWDEPAVADVRRARDRQRVELLAYEVTGVEFASRGWHPGAILYYAPARRSERGQVVVMQRGEQLRVGEYDLVWGRPVLRTDRGSFWVSPDWTLAGVVRMVEPPLIAM
ncbi:hypothetical protein [Nocardioides sp.]|uniref:hypothetical protein n=1 Tax=Nocardioides sp. TaxID=35761 RepID=UPI002630591A|nr:hypothetical protein [Nocardioides sp.]